MRLTCELPFYQKSLNLLVLLIPNSVRICHVQREKNSLTLYVLHTQFTSAKLCGSDGIAEVGIFK